MNSTNTTTSTLPDGQNITATRNQFRSVWSMWRQMARHAIANGMGVSITVDGDVVRIETVYAPLYERHCAEITAEGFVNTNHEQDAAELTEMDGDTKLPWE